MVSVTHKHTYICTYIHMFMKLERWQGPPHINKKKKQYKLCLGITKKIMIMKNKCSAHLMDKWQIMNNTIDTKKNIHGASLLHHFVVIRATQTHQNPNSKSPARILSCPRNLRTAAWPSRPPQHCVLFCWSAFGSAHRQTHKHEHTNPRTLLSQVTYKLSSVLFFAFYSVF